VRFIAGANRRLEALVAGGRLRNDLWTLLARIVIEIPPLRVRGRSAIRRLAEDYVEGLCVYFKMRRRLTEQAVDALCAHSWPGNIRQLQNSLEWAFLAADGNEITDRHLTN
jgi:DNA-binding NtrC family response regulator